MEESEELTLNLVQQTVRDTCFQGLAHDGVRQTGSWFVRVWLTNGCNETSIPFFRENSSLKTKLV